MTTSLLSTVVMLATPFGTRSADWNSVVNAIGYHESRMLHYSVGDAGMSRGAWQLSEAAWRDVNQSRRSQRKMLYAWRPYAHHGRVAQAYASAFLAITTKRLSQALGRPPTVQELYAAYNVGFDGFKNREFLLARCPKVTRDGADEVAKSCTK